MLATILSWLAVLIVTFTSASLLLSRDWRWSLGLLVAQYAGVAVLVGQHWPLGMAAAKLVTGWMATAALGITLTSLPNYAEAVGGFWPQGRIFRLFMVGMVGVLAAAVTPRLESSLAGIGAPVVAGAIILTGVGLLQLGTNSNILSVILALLTTLSGFEILYAAMEGSILVAALLAVVNLGLGLVGAYLLNASVPEEEGLSSAPFLWIILPILIGGFCLLLISERATAMTGGIAAVVLALLALVLPIDEALILGPVSFKLAASVSFLGRNLALPPATAPLLAMIFGMCAIWFFGAEAAGVAARLVPLGFMITGLLVAAIAVQPFLFASLLIEIAVLLAIPLLSRPDERPGRGVIRFLIYQTLGMPFILFAGWLLAGVEASPGDLSFTLQSTVMLGLGFAFLLAIFPLYNWIPQLMEETPPYVGGFLIWLLPTIAIVFAMSFLDRYAWLRTSAQIVGGLRLTGLVMLVSGAWWAAFAKHFGRLMAYTAIAETGFLLLALSLGSGLTPTLVFLLLIPRGLAMAICALSLSVLRQSDSTIRFSSMQGLARSYPLASAGIVLAALSSAGFPLLAGFPARLGLWEGLSAESAGAAVWFLIGLLGLLIGAVRQLAVLITQTEDRPWSFGETIIQRGLLGAGMAALFVLGIFPQLMGFIVRRLPEMFQHLNR